MLKTLVKKKNDHYTYSNNIWFGNISSSRQGNQTYWRWSWVQNEFRTHCFLLSGNLILQKTSSVSKVD
jgi:hypothetical protein